ncbi:MAG: hypothetical protein ALECFALPRED_004708 [Alectoria fallacina]|uniref:Uncharacterized protein n=1 Tax=Alectoria fallacina TaxID=1903189 RepID=A0A8H3IX83_9LECA|nr:MAG: hypothetical protein ALECFALPRED_004708 [Alectoria fallacina]
MNDDLEGAEVGFGHGSFTFHKIRRTYPERLDWGLIWMARRKFADDVSGRTACVEMGQDSIS